MAEVRDVRKFSLGFTVSLQKNERHFATCTKKRYLPSGRSVCEGLRQFVARSALGITEGTAFAKFIFQSLRAFAGPKDFDSDVMIGWKE